MGPRRGNGPPLIDSLERELGKPVVTSNQASTWAALRRIGVAGQLPSGGRLLTETRPVGAATER